MAPPPKARPSVIGGARSSVAQPTPKSLAARARQLETTKAELTQEVSDVQNKLDGLQQRARDEAVRYQTFQSRVEQLRVEIEDLERSQQAVAQQESEVEIAWAADKAEYEENIDALREEALLWRQRADRLSRQVVQREREVEELGFESMQAVQERRKLQSECLSLQQECENARLDLQYSHDMLKDSGKALERMQSQKIQLEGVIQDRKQQQAALQNVMSHAGQALRNEADIERQKFKQMVTSGQLEMQRLVAEMENHQRTAVAYQQALGKSGQEVSRLEQELAKGERARAELEKQAHDMQLEIAEEKRLEIVAKELVVATRARREQLEKQVEQLRGESKLVSSQTIELQEQHARIALKEAQVLAVKALKKDPAMTNDPGKPPPVSDSAEPSVYAGFFKPAGSARVAREREREKQQRRMGHLEKLRRRDMACWMGVPGS